jgi:hypothetical protein
MKKIYVFITAVLATAGIVGLSIQANVSAQQLSACGIDGGSSLCQDERTKGDYKKVIKNVANFLLYIVGIASVFAIVIAGIRYIASANDSGRIAGAKSTLLYAVVGLALSMVAYVIVNWVLTTIGVL